METWRPTEGAKYGIAIYNFDGKVNHGLQLDIGDAVQIFEGCAGWYRGCCLRNKAEKGIFPASFIQLKECIVENLGTPLEVITPSGDAIIKEVTAVLREWLALWKELFLKNSQLMFVEMKKIMYNLVNLRLKILSGVLTQFMVDDLKAEMTSKIDFWNSEMDLDLVPRIDGVAADVDTTSVVELYKIHVQSSKESNRIKREPTIPKSSFSIVKAHRHLLLSVKTFVCNIEDNLEVYFSLFNGDTEMFVSDRFVMYLNKEILPDVAENLSSDKTKALFTDLGKKSFSTELFIVCQVVRIGHMHTEQSPRRRNSPNFRRPFACGVFNVQENIDRNDDQFGEDRPFSVPLFACSNEANFHNMYEDLIRKFLSKSSTPSGADGMSMSVSLKVFNGDRNRIIGANPLLIPAGISVARKLGFPDVILPGDVRNDVFITLEKGDFEKGGRAAGRNVEVTATVLLSDGTVVENCIYAGSGSKGSNEYNSLILYHNNNPTWNETFRLNIPIDKFHDCHVLFVFKHCSTATHVREKGKKPFGFAFLKPLKADGTTIVNDRHQLNFYKIGILDYKNPGKYLSQPSTVTDLTWTINQDSLSHSVRSSRESFSLFTLTCSTKLTQNLDLVGLLRWRQEKDKIPEVLASLVNVRGDEIMKFLQDILDALFSILNEDTEASGMLVFNNVISIINLLLDAKYEEFQAVLNTYISQHFSAALAHRHIIPLFNKVMSISENKDGSVVLKVAKALRYIIKFVIQSWALNLRIQSDKSELEFKNSVRELFTKLNKAMERNGDGWRGSQSAILLNIPKVYKELSTVFKDDELADIFKDLFCSARSSSLISSKLNFLDGLITTSSLFHNESSRATLMPLVLNFLHQQLFQKNELKSCAEILGNLLSCLSKVTNGSVNSEVEQISKSLLEVVFQAVVTVDRNSPRAGQYVAILYTLLKMMSEDNYETYLKSIENKKDLRDFLNKAFGVFTNLLQRNIYQDDWFVMKIEGNYVILGAVQNFSLALTENFLCEDSFDYQLWSTYFHLAISFVSHEILDLNKYSEAKRTKILEKWPLPPYPKRSTKELGFLHELRLQKYVLADEKILKYGDMRHVMGFELVRMWNSLGDLQVYFVPSMIAPFLEMTLVPEPVLRQETLPLFYDMMEKEMKNFGSIKKVEEEFVDKLDVFLSKNGLGDEEYTKLFEKIITEKITRNEELRESGVLFVNSVVRLLERLLDYRKVVSSREEHRDMKMSCIVNLMNYYEEKGKQDMFLRYLSELYGLHLSAKNYVEAGFTLFLYASCLEFEDYQMLADAHFPAQSERARKESLYRRSIEHLDEGKLWESAIRICKTLIHEYEIEAFDFIKLSKMLQLEAKFYENIIKTHRLEPSYFRVGFYGKAFPSFLQNKQFVYRGGPGETMSQFYFRIQHEYPDAEVLRHNNPLDEELMLSNKQYIQCCKVEPISENRSLPGDVNYRISSYFDANWVDSFQLTRPFHKGEQKDKTNEFATLWCEVITLTIETRLPGILPWFPVILSKRRELSPIENAINTVTSKTRELLRNIEKLQEDQEKDIKPLSLQLKGVIDAAVNGGISNYTKAFFTSEYARTNPQRKTEVDNLEKALLEQAGVLRRGLILHESTISPDLRPLHESMLYQYNNMLNDLPGDTRGYVLIQRKWSLPLNSSPSESTTSLDKRISTDSSESGTLRKRSLLTSKFFPSRKPMPTFNQDIESDRQSTLSEFAMKTSSSLLSISELDSVTQSLSVPDLRTMQDDTRPKLPQKLRAGKYLNEDSGCPASPARVSFVSSASASSLNDINELDELKSSYNVDAPSLKIDRTSPSRTRTPQAKSEPVLADSESPKIPPKRPPSLTPKKRQSNIFELSNNGSYRVSITSAQPHSRSMDDLDKIGDESAIQKEHEQQTTYSEENLFASNEKQISCKDSNDNLNISDEETPPPLFPRKRREPRPEDGYDTLVVRPNLAYRLRPFPNSRPNTDNTVQVTPGTTSGDAENGLKHEGNTKHRYANLDGEIPPSQEQQNLVHSNSGTDEEDPYDVLVSPSRNGGVDGNTGRSDTTSTSIAGGNSPKIANVGRKPDVDNAYDTLVLSNSPPANTNTALLQIQDEAPGNVDPGSQDQSNSKSPLYEYHVPRGSTLNTAAPRTVANVVSNFEKRSRDDGRPTLPPKPLKGSNLLLSKQPATLSSSKLVTQSIQKYSPPVAKKPPRTLPKPSDNNVA